MKISTVLLAASLFLAMPAIASAQHGHSQHENHGHENHQHENHGHENRGHENRREHRHFDEHYRHDHFGRGHAVECHELGWDHGRFFFGGGYWNLTYFPDYWLPYDVVYVDFFDGDYYLYNDRLHARVAIVVVD